MAIPNRRSANLLSFTWRGVPTSPSMFLTDSLYFLINLAKALPSFSFFPRSSSAILPTSVSIPVATTTPRPRPLETVLDDQTMFWRSPIGQLGSFAIYSGCLAMGKLSPVSRASLVSKFMASKTLRSAGTTSPTWILTTSPTTSSSALILSILPWSRMTVAMGADSEFRLCIVFSAR
jgi:hypothetical protein